MIDNINGWIQTIASNSPDNPNLLRFWFAKLSSEFRPVKIDAANVGEAWRDLSALLIKAQHPDAFELCDPCNGRGWLLNRGRDCCPECDAKGWKAA